MHTSKYVSPDIIFSHDELKLRLPTNLLRGSIINKPLCCDVLTDECLESFVKVVLTFYWVRFNKEFFVAEYL